MIGVLQIVVALAGTVLILLWAIGSVNRVVVAQERKAAAARLRESMEILHSSRMLTASPAALGKSINEDLATLYGPGFLLAKGEEAKS